MSTNRRVVHVLAMAFIVLATVTVSSLAADGGPAPAGVTGKNVLGFKLGGYFPDSSDLEDFDAGANVELFLERIISRNFSLGAALGYQETSNSSTSPQLNQDVSSTYLLVNAKLMIPVQAFEPYAEVGGGYYFTHIKESFPSGSISEQDASFGYFAGGGVNWFFTKDYFLGLGGRYFWSETNDLNIALDGLLVDVNLGVRF